MVHATLHTHHLLFSVVRPREGTLIHGVRSLVRSSVKVEVARSSVVWIVTWRMLVFVTGVSVQRIGFNLQGGPETTITTDKRHVIARETKTSSILLEFEILTKRKKE